MSEKLYCGWGRLDICPKTPVSLAGYFNTRYWDKILDDIEVRAVVFKQGETYAGIVSYDIVSAAQCMIDRVWEKIADLKMFSKANLIFTAVHSHTAPDIRNSAHGGDACLEQIAEATSVALRAALNDLQEAELVQGETYDNRFIFNRRYWMKSGGVVTNPGKFNPDILRSEGTVDPDIPLFGVKRNGKLDLLFINVVNHSDCIGGNGVSADWPGFCRRAVQAELGDNTMALVMIGTAGNINHFDVNSDRNQTCYEEARRIGNGIAATVIAALNTLKPCCDMALETRFAEVPVPAHEVPQSVYDEAKATIEKYKDEPDVIDADDLTSEDLAKKTPMVLKYFATCMMQLHDEPKNALFPLPAIFLGGVAILGLPGEPFVEIGLELRKKIFNDYRTLLATHGPTGHPKLGGGYIPNSFNYGRGGYETEGRSNPFSEKASTLILEAYSKMAGRN